MRRWLRTKLKNVSLFYNETTLLAVGSMLCKQQASHTSDSLNDYEFQIFSQWGDDGIIQYLIRNIRIENESFIEFGVGDYEESNTRFLLMNNNWSGFILDGSQKLVNEMLKRNWYWRYDIRAQAAFIDRDNINELLARSGFRNLGLLHIDLDGNDYHIFENMDLSRLNPSLIILEYNSVFGYTRPVSVPYDKHFTRGKAHYSHLYYGASLPALTYLANKRNYALIGGNLTGNNAYFVRKDLLNDRVKEVPVEKAYRESKFREGRTMDFSLSYLSGPARLELLRGLEVINVVTGEREKL